MTDHPTLDEMIDRLKLEPHPEGGFFREVWRSPLELPAGVLTDDHDGERNAGTSILYLLPEDDDSAPHRVCSAELWLYQYGNPLRLTIEPPGDERATEAVLGPGPNQAFQKLVPPNHWQKARPLPGAAGYTLVGCVVVPGFDFQDFEMR